MSKIKESYHDHQSCGIFDILCDYTPLCEDVINEIIKYNRCVGKYCFNYANKEMKLCRYDKIIANRLYIRSDCYYCSDCYKYYMDEINREINIKYLL